MIVYKENNLSKYVFLNLTLHFGGVLSSLVIGICFKGMTPGRPKNHRSLPKKRFPCRTTEGCAAAEWLGGLLKTPSHEVPKSLRLDLDSKFLCFFFGC